MITQTYRMLLEDVGRWEAGSMLDLPRSTWEQFADKAGKGVEDISKPLEDIVDEWREMMGYDK